MLDYSFFFLYHIVHIDPAVNIVYFPWKEAAVKAPETYWCGKTARTTSGSVLIQAILCLRMQKTQLYISVSFTAVFYVQLSRLLDPRYNQNTTGLLWGFKVLVFFQYKIFIKCFLNTYTEDFSIVCTDITLTIHLISYMCSFLFVHPSLYPSIHPSVHLQILHPLNSSTHLLTLYIHPSIYFIRISLTIYSTTHPSIHPSTIHLSVYRSFSINPSTVNVHLPTSACLPFIPSTPSYLPV